MRAQFDAVTRIATDPVMLAALAEIQAAPEEERDEVARRVASREALIERGLEVPDTFRIAIRDFEDPDEHEAEGIVTAVAKAKPGKPAPGKPKPTKPKPKPKPGPTICASVGYILCASVGQNY